MYGSSSSGCGCQQLLPPLLLLLWWSACACCVSLSAVAKGNWREEGEDLAIYRKKKEEGSSSVLPQLNCAVHSTPMRGKRKRTLPRFI
jgi:hypothetical protein